MGLRNYDQISTCNYNSLFCAAPPHPSPNRITIHHLNVMSYCAKPFLSLAIRSNKWIGRARMVYIQGNHRYISTNLNNDLIVSILGPPNAGKSTLFNRLMCKESNRAYKLGSEKKGVRGRSQVKDSVSAIFHPLI